MTKQATMKEAEVAAEDNARMEVTIRAERIQPLVITIRKIQVVLMEVGLARILKSFQKINNRVRKGKYPKQILFLS